MIDTSRAGRSSAAAPHVGGRLKPSSRPPPARPVFLLAPGAAATAVRRAWASGTRAVDPRTSASCTKAGLRPSAAAPAGARDRGSDGEQESGSNDLAQRVAAAARPEARGSLSVKS